MLTNKTPVFIVLLALCWAFIADPLISLLARTLEPRHQNLFRSVNDLIVILIISLVLYRRIDRQQSQLRFAAEQYRRLFQDIPAPMYVYDRHTLEFLAVNDAAVQRYGYTADELLKMKVTNIRPPEEIDQLMRVIASLPEGYSNAGRWRHQAKTGELFYVRVYAQPTLFENRQALQIVAIDIDKKVKTELALQEKTAELENVLESITDAFYTVDKEWRFTYMNGEYERVQKRRRVDLLGKNIWEEFPYATQLRFYKAYHEAVAQQESAHFEEYNPWREMWVTVNAYPTANGLAIYFRDITEEKRIREQIYRDGQNLRAIINNTRDLIWSVDRDFKIITGNDPFWQQIAGLTGKTPAELSNADLDPDLLQSYIAYYRRAFTGEAFSTVIERTAGAGLRTYRQLSFNPIRDQQEVIGVNCFMRDITEQQQHLEKIEKQNDSLREIAWTQSHRVRAPLANVLGLIPLFDTADPASPENLVVLEKIKAAAGQLDQVIREIVDFAAGET